MPEGHIIHRLARDLGSMRGQRLAVSSPQGRFAGASVIDGHVLTSTSAHGKHLFVGFDDSHVHVHLGLYGAFARSPLGSAPVGQVRLRLEGDDECWDLRGPTVCELLDPAGVSAVTSRLGPDPLRRAGRARARDEFVSRASRSRTPAGLLLMDQTAISGVGNVYRAEVLFRARIDPRTPSRELAPDVWGAVWEDLVELMRLGVRRGRIDTVEPEHDPRLSGREARRDRHGGEVYVYRRAGLPCHVCGTEVAVEVAGARNLFWCPLCQSSAVGAD